MKKTIKSLTIKHYFHAVISIFCYTQIFLTMLPSYSVTEMTVLYIALAGYSAAAACRYERLMNKAKAKAKQMYI